MPLSYYDKQRAVARVGMALKARGWTLFGYHEDQSDSMSDYFHPAHWDGVATSEQYPGVVVGVDVSASTVPYRSGKPQEREEWVDNGNCPHCGGTGVEPDALTYEQALANPDTAHKVKADAAQGFTVIAYGPGGASRVSRSDYHGDGSPRCLECHGNRVQKKRIPHLVCTWPEFHATPKGKLWHIAYNGQIIGHGTGFEKCAEHSYRDDRWKTAVAQVCDEIEAIARRCTAQPTATGGAAMVTDDLTPTSATRNGITVSCTYTCKEGHDTWTWLEIAPRVSRDAYDRARNRFGIETYRFGKKMHIRRHLTAQEILDVLVPPPAEEVVAPAAQTEREPVAEPESQLEPPIVETARAEPTPEPATPPLPAELAACGWSWDTNSAGTIWRGVNGKHKTGWFDERDLALAIKTMRGMQLIVGGRSGVIPLPQTLTVTITSDAENAPAPPAEPPLVAVKAEAHAEAEAESRETALARAAAPLFDELAKAYAGNSLNERSSGRVFPLADGHFVCVGILGTQRLHLIEVVPLDAYQGTPVRAERHAGGTVGTLMKDPRSKRAFVITATTVYLERHATGALTAKITTRPSTPPTAEPPIAVAPESLVTPATPGKHGKGKDAPAWDQLSLFS